MNTEPKIEILTKLPEPAKLGAATAAVLKAIDASEYGDALKDEIWQFSAKEHSGLSDHAFGGAIAVLRKKGLITYSIATERASESCTLAESNGIAITDAGIYALECTGYTFRKRH